MKRFIVISLVVAHLGSSASAGRFDDVFWEEEFKRFQTKDYPADRSEEHIQGERQKLVKYFARLVYEGFYQANYRGSATAEMRFVDNLSYTHLVTVPVREMQECLTNLHQHFVKELQDFRVDGQFCNIHYSINEDGWLRDEPKQ